MSNELKEKMREEAIKRLELLNLHPDVLKYFKKEETVYYSERTSIGGILYYVTNEDKFVRIIKDIEEKYGVLVYHCTHENTGFGECLTMLYVPKETEEWEMDKEDLENTVVDDTFITAAYVYNITYPEYSEFGSVALKEKSGGLIRVA